MAPIRLLNPSHKSVETMEELRLWAGSNHHNGRRTAMYGCLDALVAGADRMGSGRRSNRQMMRSIG